MSELSDAIVLAEQHAAEARTALRAEYQAMRASLRRCMSSPVFIGGVLLGAITLGYLAAGRGKPTCPVCRESPGEGSRVARVVKAVQVLLPLLLALASSTSRRAAPPRSVNRS